MADRLAAFIEQARACIKGGQFDEAVEFARQAVDLAPADPDALTVLGAALSKAEMPQEATEVLLNAVRAEPQSSKRRYNLAAHFYRFGWKEEAKAELVRALELDPNYGKAKELMRRIELDRWQPPALRYQSADPALPDSAPPVQASPKDFYVVQVGTRKKHAFDFIERMGIAWDVLLVAVFTIHAVLMVVAITEILSHSLRGAYATVTGLSAYGISWFFFVLVWVVDLLDRRPTGSHVLLAVLAIGITFPACLVAFLPVLGAVMFLAYVVSTRRE